jgi:hypothetical protein
MHSSLTKQGRADRRSAALWPIGRHSLAAQVVRSSWVRKGRLTYRGADAPAGVPWRSLHLIFEARRSRTT